MLTLWLTESTGSSVHASCFSYSASLARKRSLKNGRNGCKNCTNDRARNIIIHTGFTQYEEAPLWSSTSIVFDEFRFALPTRLRRTAIYGFCCYLSKRPRKSGLPVEESGILIRRTVPMNGSSGSTVWSCVLRSVPEPSCAVSTWHSLPLTTRPTGYPRYVAAIKVNYSLFKKSWSMNQRASYTLCTTNHLPRKILAKQI